MASTHGYGSARACVCVCVFSLHTRIKRRASVQFNKSAWFSEYDMVANGQEGKTLPKVKFKTSIAKKHLGPEVEPGPSAFRAGALPVRPPKHLALFLAKFEYNVYIPNNAFFHLHLFKTRDNSRNA